MMNFTGNIRKFFLGENSTLQDERAVVLYGAVVHAV